MEDENLEHEHHVQSALQTMQVADPDHAEELFKEYFGAGSSTWTAWDEQFVTFIEAYKKPGLIYGTIGNGWHFLFCASAGKGFWVCAHEAMRGKGFLRPNSVAALKDLALQKGLIEE